MTLFRLTPLGSVKKCLQSLLSLLPLLAVSSLYSQPLEIEVGHVEVVGNTLLPDETLGEVLGPLPSKMTAESIQKTAQNLQKAYRGAGYGAVVVLVPEQTLSNGILKLEVIEGKLREVLVTGQQGFSTGNILHSLPALQIGQTPRLSELDTQLLMANENPAKNVRVVFQPGEKRGEVESLVVVEEQPLDRWQFGLDNTGNNSSGRYRLNLSYQHANVADRDVVWGLRASTSPTRYSDVLVLGTTLRVPVYRKKTFLEGSFLASNTRSANNSTPAGDLRFSGSGVAAGLRAVWTVPSLSETKRQASIGIDARRYSNQCTLGDFGAAGCGAAAAASVTVLPLTAAYVMQQQGRYSITGQLVANLPLGSAGNDDRFEASRPGARSSYQLFRVNAYAQQRLSDQWTLSARADAQWSGQALVSAEQFGVGGANSVRGYEERALNTDAGVSGSLELRSAMTWVTGGHRGPLTPTLGLFLDAAQARNKLGTACQPNRSHCNLWGAGAGVSYSPTPRTSLRLDLARAGKAVNSTRSGEWRLHFNLNHAL